MIQTVRERIIGGDAAALANAVDAQHESCRATFNRTVAEVDRLGRLPSQFDLFKRLTQWRLAGVVGNAPTVVQRGAVVQARTACAKHRDYVEKMAWRLHKDLQQEAVAVEWLAQLPNGHEAPSDSDALKRWLDGLPKSMTPAKEIRSALLHKPLKCVKAPRSKTSLMRSRKEYESGKHRPALHFLDRVKRIDESTVQLPGIGRVAIKGHLPEGVKIAGAQLVERTPRPQGRGGIPCPQSKRRFALHLQIKKPDPEIKPLDGGQALGVDMGIANAAGASDHRLWRFTDQSDAFDRIAESQRRNAKRKVGSVAWRSEKGMQRRLWTRINNRRLNEVRHLALALVESTSLLAIEDLRLPNMMRSAQGSASMHGANVNAKRKLNKRLAQSTLGSLRQALKAACEKLGVTLCVVPPKNSSRTCAACGHCESGNRESQSEFLCLACGHKAHADVNAAIVILQWTLAQLGRELQAGDWASRPLMAQQLQRCMCKASSAVNPNGRPVEVQMGDSVRLRTETGRREKTGCQNRRSHPLANDARKRLSPTPSTYADGVELSV